MTLRKIIILQPLMKYSIWAIITRIFDYYLKVDEKLYSAEVGIIQSKTCSHYAPHVLSQEVPSTTKVFFLKTEPESNQDCTSNYHFTGNRRKGGAS